MANSSYSQTHKTTKGSSKQKKTTEKKPKASFLVKPDDMTLEQWQIALREQVAATEKFVVEEVKDKSRKGYYTVKKPIYKKPTYKDGPKAKPKLIGYGPMHTVVYRGQYSQWNYCACMDFKTSRLGTCKHIEAVKLWLTANNKKPVITTPTSSSVYIDYVDERKIKIRIGKNDREELDKIVGKHFDKNGVLRHTDEDQFYQFLYEAQSLIPSFRCYPDVLERINEIARMRNLQQLSSQIDDKFLDNLLQTKLFKYQKEGIKFAFKHGKSIIADEMGLGKTIQAIGVAEALRRFRLITSVLVVCPTSLKYQWKHEIEKFTKSTVCVVEGNALKRKDIYDNGDAFYKIVSYNALANDIKMQGELVTDLLILDEVQRLKNWDTVISKATRKVKSAYSVILSGTPLENKLEELYSIVEFVDQYMLSPYYKFRQECIVTDDAGMTIGYQNLTALNKKLKDVLIRRRKKDVALQMPARMDKTLYVPMTKEQSELHDEFYSQVCKLVKKWRTYHFLSEIDRQRLMLFLSQMRMVANSTYILDQKTRYDTKIDELMCNLSEIFESGDEKVVIFSGWERMTRIIAQELDKMGVKYANLNGKVPSAKRKTLVEDFTNDPNCRVFLSTDAGATGLNLQAGSIIINMELPWNPAVLEQRIGRIYRLGQMRNIQVINMVSLNSFERDIETKIKFKSALFEGALDDGSDTVFLPEKSKFDELIESLDKIVEEKETSTESSSDNSHTKETTIEEPEPIATEKESIITTQDDIEQESEEVSQPVATVAPRPDALVSDGLKFLSGIVETLKSPERTKELVDTIVKTDKETGKTTLQIPIPDKSVVSNLISAISALFAK